jgi:hypothetical protein
MKFLFWVFITLTICAVMTGCSKSSSSLSTPVSSPSSTMTSPLSIISPAPTSDSTLAPKYFWEEAVNHIGETATVTGPIINSIEMSISNYIVLGMGKKFQEQGYVGIAIKFDKSLIPSDMYIGRTISAFGYINRNGFGGAAVEVTEPSSIAVVQ